MWVKDGKPARCQLVGDAVQLDAIKHSLLKEVVQRVQEALLQSLPLLRHRRQAVAAGGRQRGSRCCMLDWIGSVPAHSLEAAPQFRSHGAWGSHMVARRAFCHLAHFPA